MRRTIFAILSAMVCISLVLAKAQNGPTASNRVEVELVPFQSSLSPSPHDATGQPIPGVLQAFLVPKDVPLRLSDPSDGQTVILLPARPDGLPLEMENSIVVSAVKTDSADSSHQTLVYGTGHFSMLVNPVAGSMQPTVGHPYTELNITKLKVPLFFYKHEWAAKNDGESLIIVTWKNVIGVNVSVTESAPSKDKVVTTQRRN